MVQLDNFHPIKINLLEEQPCYSQETPVSASETDLDLKYIVLS